MNNHIAVITVVYNNYTVLDDFLNSLRKQKDTTFHLFISDASTERQEIDTKDLDTTVLQIENKGYAHGVNVGLHKAQEMGYEKFCVINDDVLFETNFIQSLHRSFRNNPYSAFGGKIYYAHGYEYHANRYEDKDKGNVIWYAGGAIDWSHATTSHIGVDGVDAGQFDEVKETEFITGCLFCFDKYVVDSVGFWDESYFMYYEDADYSVRITRHGIKLYYMPDINVWHKNAQSTEGSGSKLHQQLQKKSRFRFAMKHAPWRTKVHVFKNQILSF